MTLIEILVVVFSLSIGCQVAMSAGNHYGLFGGLLGFLVGVAILPAILAVLLWFSRQWFGVGHPPCRSGTCASDDYRYEMDRGRLLLRCACGRRYQESGRHFDELAADASVIPYMTWKPFHGWRAEVSPMCRGYGVQCRSEQANPGDHETESH
jgi:hypothetical protein